MRKKLLTIIGASVICFNSQANTFVGNGGNAGDVELAVTQRQISETMKLINQDPNSTSLCECTSTFLNHRECDSLQDLNQDQKAYCSAKLKSVSDQIVALLSPSSKTEMVWTHEKISVVEDGRIRAADAVAETDAQKITINQGRFLNLSPSERIFLLSHELLHLADFNGQKVTDRGSIGPFTSPSGQKEFLNALSAAVVMQAEIAGQFDKYKKILRRPQSYKENWLDGSFAASFPLEDSDNNFHQSKFNGGEVAYRRYFERFNLLVAYRYEKATKNILTSIEAEEKVHIVTLAAGYRFFPFSDPLTRWGQSYLSTHVGVQHLNSTYRIADSTTEGTSKASSVNLTAGCKYYIPFGDFWFHGGLEVSPHSYDHALVGLKNESIRLTTTLGVSHGF